MCCYCVLELRLLDPELLYIFCSLAMEDPHLRLVDKKYYDEMDRSEHVVLLPDEVT
jgi:hypothetical protein